MADHKKDQQIDEMLDSLLNNYSAVQPRPGLETRMLAHVHDAAGDAKPSQSWGFKWGWMAAAALAGIVGIAVLVGLHRKSAPPTVVHMTQPAAPQPHQQSVQPQKIITGAANHPPKKHVALTAQNVNLPIYQRPNVFPTPEPLSKEEKLLVRYVTRTPREELMAQSRPFEPFRLEPEGNQSGTTAQKPKESTETR